MLIIFCIFNTERTGLLIENIMCLRTMSAVCIFTSDIVRFFSMCRAEPVNF